MSRHVLSTHLTKLAAKRALAHYEHVQYAASLEGPAGEYARLVCAQLGVSLEHEITVTRARHERGRWAVVVA